MGKIILRVNFSAFSFSRLALFFLYDVDVKCS